MQNYLYNYLTPVSVFLFVLSTFTAILKYIFPDSYRYLDATKVSIPIISQKLNLIALMNILAGLFLFLAIISISF